VNVFGRIIGDARQFKGISSGTAVMVTKVG
jgi:hypothetical protein